MALVAMLSACGGGGGGEPTAPPTGAPPTGAPPTGAPPTSPPGPGTPAPASGTLSLVAGDIGAPARIDGTGAAARFVSIKAMALDAQGNAYVADESAIRKVTSQGVVTTPFPRKEGDSCYTQPRDVAVGTDGDLYVLDGTGRLCRQALTGAGAVSEVAPAGSVPQAFSIARGTGGSIHVASLRQVWRVVPGSAPVLLAGSAESSAESRDGTGAAARFNGIAGITVDAAGNSFVVEFNNGVRKVTPDGVVTTVAQVKLLSNPFGQFDRGGIATDSAGNVYVPDVADLQNGRQGSYGGSIIRVTPAGQTSAVAGSPGLFRGNPPGLAVDAQGNLMYASTSGISRLSANGTTSLLAGSAGPLLEAPLGMDNSGNLITINDPFRTMQPLATLAEPRLRKMTHEGTVLPYAPSRPVLGLPAPDNANRFFAVTIDRAQNVYASYTRGSRGTSGPATATETEVYRVAPDGVGTRIYLGKPEQADFAAPVAMAAGPDGSLYFVDGLRRSIRKMAANGSLSAVTADGTVSDAAVSWGVHLALSPSGQVFLLGNPLDPMLYTVNASQQLAVVARLADAPPPVGPAVDTTRFSGLVVDAGGNAYVVDGSTLRKVTPAGAVSTVAGSVGGTQVTPGELPGSLAKSHSPVLASDGSIYLRSGGAIVRIRPN